MFVTLTAPVILLLLVCYPFRSTVVGLVSVAIAGTLLLFAHVVLTDMDNPFESMWNVSSEPFSDLLTEVSIAYRRKRRQARPWKERSEHR